MNCGRDNIEIWQNYFDIVILPPPRVRDYSIALSKQLAVQGAKFVLGKTRYLPHISLYHIPVRPEQFDDFVEQVKDIVTNCEGGELTLTAIKLPLLLTDKPLWFEKLHLRIINETTRFFDWKYGAEDFWNPLSVPAHLRDQAARNLEQYGSLLVGSEFSPHITLTSFEDKTIADRISVPTLERMRFSVDAIHICQLGPSHSCQRIIEKIKIREDRQ
jgi:hypothetical protein